MSCGKEKRKRTKNTSNNQYELYLQFMENNYAFRSETINPTMEENYIEKKWEELTQKLNTLGEAPSMSAEEWRKRFRDWKNATRSKYRKIVVDRNKTGSGPQLDIKMTNLEERGLSVWGKVTVTGEPASTSYEGISTTATTSSMDHQLEEELVTRDTLFVDDNLDIFVEPTIIDNNDTETMGTQSTIPDIQVNTRVNVEKKVPVRNKTRKTVQKQKTNIENVTQLAQTIIATNKDVQNSMSNLNITLQNFSHNYLHIQKEKLRFEVEKFKYENTDFAFSLNFDDK